MSMSDPVADMITRIRNALGARHDEVQVPGSNLKRSLAQVLKDEGYINDFQWVPDNKQGMLHIKLKWHGNTPVIQGLKRVSKPSRRVYVPSDDIPKVRHGLGIAVLSTNKGLLSDRKAREAKVGGEVICEVW